MSEEQIPRRLKVDLSGLEAAFDDTSWERGYYRDLETGETVMVTDETRHQLERIYDEAAPEETADEEVDITTVRNQRLQDRLWQAITGRHPFRQFKDVLADNPTEGERWFRFKDSRVRERVLEWLEEEGIEPIGE